MNPMRPILVVLALLFVGLCAWWIRDCSPMARRQRAAFTAAPTPTTTLSPTPTAPLSRQPIYHRLAGVATGQARFVAIEHPNGGNALYRLGDDVPGLGRILEITEDAATFEGEDGRFRLQVNAPPARTPTATTPTPAATATRSAPAPGRTPRESPLSGARDRSAS